MVTCRRKRRRALHDLYLFKCLFARLKQVFLQALLSYVPIPTYPIRYSCRHCAYAIFETLYQKWLEVKPHTE